MESGDLTPAQVRELLTSLTEEEQRMLDFFCPDGTDSQKATLIAGRRRDAEAVNGAAILDKIEAFLRRFVVLPNEDDYAVLTLWAAHTHAFRAWYTTPRLCVLAPEKNCGKTRVLEVTALFVADAISSVNMTTAYMFRRYQGGHPTILLDETDALFATGRGGKLDPAKEELRGVVNAGYKRGATVGRVETIDKMLIPTDYPVFGAVALAGVGLHHLPDTITSRGISILLKRRAPHEEIEHYRDRIVQRDSAPIAADLARWARESAGRLQDLIDNDSYTCPHEVVDRNREAWEPLLVVAEVAGGDWPKKAQEAAIRHVANYQDSNSSTTGARLLKAVRAIFDSGYTQISSADLVAHLINSEDADWSWMTPVKLAGLVSDYGIRPGKLRIGDGTPNGYKIEHFIDAWERYL